MRAHSPIAHSSISMRAFAHGSASSNQRAHLSVCEHTYCEARTLTHRYARMDTYTHTRVNACTRFWGGGCSRVIDRWVFVDKTGLVLVMVLGLGSTFLHFVLGELGAGQLLLQGHGTPRQRQGEPRMGKRQKQLPQSWRVSRRSATIRGTCKCLLLFLFRAKTAVDVHAQRR